MEISRIPEGTIFGYDHLNIAKEKYVTAAKVLERLQKKGVIKKISKGIFYKPKVTIFGELKPNEKELLRPYLFDNGNRIAYVTGNYLYNQLGLTTQLTGNLKIACRSKRIYVSTGAIKATPVKSYTEVTDNNYQLLGFLDAMKDFKKIPDIDIKMAIVIFSDRINKLEGAQLNEIVEYALLYPPRVRAFLGAILEYLNKTDETKRLKASLNPLSKYVMGISPQNLQTVSSWNIL